MGTPKAFLFGVGDSRDKPESWILPHHQVALEASSEQFRQAGFEPIIVSRTLFQKVRDANQAAIDIERQVTKGDVLVPMCIGWGLPGIVGAVLTRLRGPLQSGDLKLHFHSNLLPQYPGFVLAAACVQIAEEMGVKSTREIILNWDDESVVDRLRELRDTGTIKRSTHTFGEIVTTTSDTEAARRLSEKIEGTVYGPIGGSSMLMAQGYPRRDLLMSLGMVMHDIGMTEFLHAADAVKPDRARSALKFCLNRGLKVADDVSEAQMLRQMQYLLGWDGLWVKYGLGCGGHQGQFDLTHYHPSEDFATAAMNSRCRPETDGRARVAATENDFYAAMTMLILQKAVEVVHKMADDSVGFHDFRHLVEHPIIGVSSQKRWLIVLLNSGALNFRDLTGRDDTMKGVTAEMQNMGYFWGGGVTSGGEMVSFDNIVYPGPVAQPGRQSRVATWARLVPKGWGKFCLQAGHCDIVGISHDNRIKLYGELDQNWPFGLLRPYCDTWELAYHFYPNHIHHVPCDVLSVLAAFAKLMGWEFQVMGVKSE